MAVALIVVDVQGDFTVGGALEVAGADRVIDRVNDLAASPDFDLVVATRDWHPPDHGSFERHGGPWPVHCVADTPGAQLDPGLERASINATVDKGQHPGSEGYSGFQDTALASLLRDEGIDAVTVVGLATDYCVKHTALDALREGFAVTVDASATAGVEVRPGDVERALDELRRSGVVVIGAPVR
jgi:nicotinamidase/pyrazinamidase